MGPDLIDNRLNEGAAIIAAARCAKTISIESSKSIVESWMEIRKFLSIESDADFLAVILSSGRVMDIDPDSFNIVRLVQVIENISKELQNCIDENEMDEGAIAIAKLTASYVAVTRKIESVKDIVSLFNDFRKNIEINGIHDILAVSLLCARMRDDHHKMEPSEAPAVIRKLKEELQRAERSC